MRRLLYMQALAIALIVAMVAVAATIIWLGFFPPKKVQ
jgi:cell division protein FtsL